MLTSNFYKKNEVIIITLFFFIINFFLKILFVTKNEIAMDEPFSIFYAQMDLPSIFTMLKNENNPALHFILLHFWIKLFGIGPLSVRFLSVLFSSLTASIIFLCGNKFFSKQTGIIAAFIFTFSLFHVYFSHEARVYPLFVLLTSLSLYYFLSLVNNPEKWKPYISLLVVNILLIYAHYFGFFVLAAEFVSIFFVENFRRIWKKMLVIFAFLAISYIPNIIVFLERFSVSVEHGTWVRKPEITELYGNLNRFLNSRAVMIILLLVVALYVVLLVRKHLLFPKLSEFFRNSSSRVLIVWFIFPYLSMFVISFWAPMFLDRYIIYISVSFYLLIAVFLTTFTNNRILSYIASFALLCVMVFYLKLAPDNNRRVHEVVEVVTKLKAKAPDSFVIISPAYSYLEFTYHYNINYFKDYEKTISLLNKENIYPLSDFSSFEKTKLGGKNIVFLDCGTEFAFGKNSILNELDTSHMLVKKIPIFEIYKIYWYNPKI
jgi:mannosyltransferase